MIPRTLYTAEHEEFRQAVRKFFEKEVMPYHNQWEEDGMVDRDVWRKAGELGFLCVCMPPEYGGSGVDFRYSAILIEEQTRAMASGIGFSLHSDIVAPYILHYGSEEQKMHYLPKLASGEMVGAIAMTEPGTGSDLQGVKTTAIKNDKGYLINGSKTFITNGYHADLTIVVAKTDPNAGAQGTSLFLVEQAWEGYTRNKPLKKLGLKAQDTSELYFDNIQAPATALLGMEGAGFMYLMQELAQERLLIAIVGAEACECAINDTLKYTKERHAFGKPIYSFQNTRFKLAQLASETSMLRCYVDRCTELLVEGKLTAQAGAAAKLLASELQCKVMDECLQLHGGYGFIWEYPIARAYADSRVQRIYGGTNEIMKELISRTL